MILRNLGVVVGVNQGTICVTNIQAVQDMFVLAQSVHHVIHHVIPRGTTLNESFAKERRFYTAD